METGIELIERERKEQIEKHGFGKGHDESGLNDRGELVAAAVFILSHVPRGSILGAYPRTWGMKYREKFLSKSRVDKLKVAGALIAAEIDRLQGQVGD